jgi:hypothetical protein
MGNKISYTLMEPHKLRVWADFLIRNKRPQKNFIKEVYLMKANNNLNKLSDIRLAELLKKSKNIRQAVRIFKEDEGITATRHTILSHIESRGYKVETGGMILLDAG